MGGRGQGEDRRPADGAGAGGGPLPGRTQRRAHPGRGGREDGAPPHPVGNPPRGGRLPHRERGGAVAGRPGGRDREVGGARGGGDRAAGPERGVPAHPRVPRPARRGAGVPPGGRGDRNHPPRHRAGVRGQGGAAGNPGGRPLPPHAIPRQGRGGPRLSQLRPEGLLRCRARLRRGGLRRGPRRGGGDPAPRRRCRRATPSAREGGCEHPLRRRAGEPPRRRPRDLSLRHVVQHHRGGRGHRKRHRSEPDRPRARDHQGLRDAGRFPVRSRPSSATTSADVSGSGARSSGRPPGGRGAAAGWTRWRSGSRFS